MAAREVTRIFTVAFANRVAEPSGCEWLGAPLGSFTSAHPILRLSISRGVSESEFLRDFHTFVTPGSKPGTRKRTPSTPISGVGERAFAMLNGELLAVWSHGTVLTVELHYVSAPLATAERLATRTLSHLVHR